MEYITDCTHDDVMLLSVEMRTHIYVYNVEFVFFGWMGLLRLLPYAHTHPPKKANILFILIRNTHSVTCMVDDRRSQNAVAAHILLHKFANSIEIHRYFRHHTLLFKCHHKCLRFGFGRIQSRGSIFGRGRCSMAHRNSRFSQDVHSYCSCWFVFINGHYIIKYQSNWMKMICLLQLISWPNWSSLHLLSYCYEVRCR